MGAVGSGAGYVGFTLIDQGPLSPRWGNSQLSCYSHMLINLSHLKKQRSWAGKRIWPRASIILWSSAEQRLLMP